MENGFFRLRFDRQGYLSSIFDRRVGRELLVKGRTGNLFQLFEDKPGIYDAWDIILTYREREWPVKGLKSIEVVENGPVRTVVRLDDKNELRLSGLLWPEAKERIAGTAYATVESVGRGQLILFATDPTYRMWLPAVQRLFANAVLLGPGMGTSQPSPW